MATAAKGPAMVMFSETELIPKVKGGPINCMACKETSVKTRICCLVSIAVIISEPDPIRKSPAVFVAVDAQSVRLS